MRPIKQSELAWCFTEYAEEDVKDINLLDEHEAVELWKRRFDATAKGLHDLPSSSWVRRLSWTVVGHWSDAWEIADRIVVSDLLSEASGWLASEPLLFIQDSGSIISLKFGHFTKYWRALLAAFGDSPLLMSASNKSGPVFRFDPLGRIRKATSAPD